jgi:MFS family permease
MQQIEQSSEQVSARAASGIYYGWVIVVVCFVVIALVSPVLGSFSVFYVAVLREFNWSRGSTAVAMSIYLLVSGATGPIAGALVDRFGPRRVLPFGALITAAALVWLSRATERWHFYIGFGVVAAMGSAMLSAVPLLAIVSRWFERRRGTAMGIVSAGQGGGQLLLVPIQQLITSIGWRSTYLVLAATVLIIPTALVGFFLYGRPEERGLRVDDEQKKENTAVTTRQSEVVILNQAWAETEWTLRRAMGTFRFWALMLVMALFAAGFFQVSTHLVAFLTDKGYSAALAASVLGVQGFVNVIGKFAGGWFADRIGRERTITMSVVLFVICIALLNLAGVVVSAPLVFVFAVFYAMGSGITLPALSASAADLFQGKHFGAIFGAITLGGLSGGAIGAWLGGFLFDLMKDYRVNFLVAAIAMLLSAALIWKARPGNVRAVKYV